MPSEVLPYLRTLSTDRDIYYPAHTCTEGDCSELVRWNDTLVPLSICSPLLGEKYETEYIKDSLEPQWKEVFNFVLGTPSQLTPEDLLEVRVYDHEFFGKDRYATARL